MRRILLSVAVATGSTDWRVAGEVPVALAAVSGGLAWWRYRRRA